MSRYEWLQCWEFNVSAGAVQCGTEAGGPVYVGITKFGNNDLPVNVVPRKKSAVVCYNGAAYDVTEFKVLFGRRPQWIPSNNGQVPVGALPVGKVHGETVYIGRTTVHKNYCPNVTVVGRVQPSKQCLIIPFNENEKRCANYEVLVFRD